MDYEITDDINKATHWIAYDDVDNKYSNVTIGKMYKLEWDEVEEEHHIIDDKGFMSLAFLVHKGDYVYID